MAKLVPVILSALLAFGCAHEAQRIHEDEPGGGGGASRPSAAPSMAPAEGQAVSFKVIEKGSQSLLTKDTEKVFSDPVAYEKWYESHNHDKKAPVVNFDKDMAVVVVLPRNTGGFDVNLDRIVANGDQITVVYTEIRPTKDMMVIQALTQPYFIATFPKRKGNVVFERHVRS